MGQHYDGPITNRGLKHVVLSVEELGPHSNQGETMCKQAAAGTIMARLGSCNAKKIHE